MAALRMLLLALLAANPLGARLAPDAPAADPDAFSLELNYWGNPVLAWRIGSDGNGEFQSSAQAPSGRFQDYDVTIRRFAAGADGFRRIHAIMDDVARLAPAELPCENRTTDMQYGQVTWHRGSASESLHFDFGCGNRLAMQVMQRLGEATTLASTWASSQPVVEVRHVRGETQH